MSMMNIPNLCISFWGYPCHNTLTAHHSLSLSHFLPPILFVSLPHTYAQLRVASSHRLVQAIYYLAAQADQHDIHLPPHTHTHAHTKNETTSEWERETEREREEERASNAKPILNFRHRQQAGKICECQIEDLPASMFQPLTHTHAHTHSRTHIHTHVHVDTHRHSGLHLAST